MTRQPLRVAAFLGIAPMIVATAIAGTAAADPTSDTEATPTPTAVEAPLPADPAPSGGDTSAPRQVSRHLRHLLRLRPSHLRERPLGRLQVRRQKLLRRNP